MNYYMYNSNPPGNLPFSSYCMPSAFSQDGQMYLPQIANPLGHPSEDNDAFSVGGQVRQQNFPALQAINPASLPFECNDGYNIGTQGRQHNFLPVANSFSLPFENNDALNMGSQMMQQTYPNIQANSTYWPSPQGNNYLLQGQPLQDSLLAPVQLGMGKVYQACPPNTTPLSNMMEESSPDVDSIASHNRALVHNLRAREQISKSKHEKRVSEVMTFVRDYGLELTYSSLSLPNDIVIQIARTAGIRCDNMPRSNSNTEVLKMIYEIFLLADKEGACAMFRLTDDNQLAFAYLPGSERRKESQDLEAILLRAKI